jgi:predicted metal-dependent hydrolase
LIVTSEKEFVVRYGSQRIPYALSFRPRRQLAINVHPDLSVTVVAPESRSIEDVLPRVQRKAAWIAKQRRYFEQFQPLPHGRKYITGETHYYLGRQYRLKVEIGREEFVKLKGRFIYINGPKRFRTEKVQALLASWYRANAERIFHARLIRCLESAPSLQMPSPRIVIRSMGKRWGSCTETGNLLINLELIKTPIDCIEYVITHELCHLRVHNHGAAYYRLLARCMPDWQRRKKRLDSFVI